MIIPFYNNGDETTDIETVKESIRAFEEVNELEHFDLKIRQKTLLEDGSDAITSHYSCTTRNICNSLLRLSTYHTIFSVLKEQNACDSTIESIIQSIPVPQALFSSCEQEMPVVSSKMMYEGYANRIITDSILLILYENGVDTAEREVIQNLVEMVKQSICNVGIYLTTTEMHFQTDRDYFQENYEIPKEKVPSTIEQITSIRESTSRSEKRNYSSISSNQSIPIEPIPISISRQFIRILQFFIQKGISPYSLLQFMYDRLDYYQRLLKIESHVVSQYQEILADPTIIQTMNIDEFIDLKAIRSALHVTYKTVRKDHSTDNSVLIDNLCSYFSSFFVCFNHDGLCKQQ